MNRRKFIESSTLALGGSLLAPSYALSTDKHLQNAPEDFAFASLVEVSEAIFTKQISSLELTQMILKRIKQYNERINAIPILAEESALAQAKEADKLLAQGTNLSPLHGIPITIKDAFEVKGLITTAGAPEIANYTPTQDALAVARLRQAGAIILGHSNVPYLLNDHQSDNALFGRTNNPWNANRTSGGSSGGAAAALATGLSYLDLGSDIGGSIRIPAHFCGVFGHKPSLNVVPMQGHIPPLPQYRPVAPNNLAVAGPMARSARDLRIALSIMGGPTPEEAITYEWKMSPLRYQGLGEHRIGYILDDPFCPVSSDVRRILEKAMDSFEGIGAYVVEGWPEGLDPEQQYYDYLYLLNAVFAYLLPRDKSAREMYYERAQRTDNSYETIQARAWTDPHREFLRVLQRQQATQQIWQNYFQDFNAFIMPTAIVPAFPHSTQPWEERILRTREGERSYYDILFWISFATYAGLPSTSVPVGKTPNGLPVGLQIMGPYLEDSVTIDLANFMEEAVGAFTAPRGFE